jgi:hypothetical protein
MFKYELNQLVWYLKDNKVHSAKIVARMAIENVHDDYASTDTQKLMWQPFGPSSVKYKTVHGIFDENVLFASRIDLSKSLLDDNEQTAIINPLDIT